LPGSDSDGHSYSCVYADSYANGHSYNYCRAEVYADAQAAAYATSTPISSSV